MAISIHDGSEPLEVNIERRPLQITGSAHDISRLLDACRSALRHYEHNRIDPSAIQTISVPTPQENEP